jgi:hypothetical protein
MIAKALDLAAVKRRGEKKKWAALLKALGPAFWTGRPNSVDTDCLFFRQKR